MIIDGRKIAKEHLQELGRKVERMKVKPKLVAILVGDDPASVTYTNLKAKRAREIGMLSEIRHLPAGRQDLSLVTCKDELITEIQKLNDDPTVTGILLQLPLPEHLEPFEQQILDAIDPKKDVDGLTTENLRLLVKGTPRFLPATVKAVETVLEEIRGQGAGISQNTSFAVVGQGSLVGKPLADFWEAKGLKVTRCDKNTSDLSHVTRESDILVVATGVANLITAEMVKPGAIVIDCGAPNAEVDFENVQKIASFITPVPGGVGPLTVVSLLENTLDAFETA